MVILSTLAFLCVLWYVGKGILVVGRSLCAFGEGQGSAALAWLEEHLRGDQPVRVTATRHYRGGDDIWFELVGGDTLRLRCFWARPVDIRYLRRARYRSDIGWVVEAEAPNGDPVHLYAWAVTHYPAES